MRSLFLVAMMVKDSKRVQVLEKLIAILKMLLEAQKIKVIPWG